MAWAGYILITAGFLLGSLAAVYHPDNRVDWAYFVPSLVLGVLGVALARLGARRAERAHHVLSGNLETLRAVMDRVVSLIRELDGVKHDHDLAELPRIIEDRFHEDLETFADARESLAHAYGLDYYAEVMNAFAAGERYLNRVWSASVDGYVDEAMEYLSRAREQFERVAGLLANPPSSS